MKKGAARKGCCAAALGSAFPTAAARPTGSATTPAAASTTLGSVSAASPQDCLLGT